MTVSIVTPVLNGAAFIRGAIESVLGQTYSNNIEHIVVDGDSDDDTPTIVREYESKGVRLVSAHDTGPAEAINRGMSLAHGDILGWLNCDDLLLPDAVTLAANCLQNQPAGFTYGHSQLIDENGVVFKNIYTCRQTAESYRVDGGNIFQGTVFFLRSAWEKCGPLDISLECAFEYKLFDSLFHTYPGAFINAKMAQYRIHAGSISSRKRALFKKELEKVRGQPAGHLLRGAYRLRRIAHSLRDRTIGARIVNRQVNVRRK